MNVKHLLGKKIFNQNKKCDISQINKESLYTCVIDTDIETIILYKYFILLHI
jgi:hypothetical protein